MQLKLRYGRPVIPILICLRRGRPGIHLESVMDTELGLELTCFRYYSFGLAGSRAEELQARRNAKEVRTMRMTWAEKLEEKGREQGVRQTLLRQLGLRFGPVSEDVRRRIEAIGSVERLNQIAEQILVARSLEEMGLR
jgi:hypothetical protein